MKKNKYFILALLLILLGITTRTVFHIKPNLEFVTACSLAAGFFFRKNTYAVLIPVFIMFGSDLIIGNTNIFIFTWTGFLVSFLVGVAMKAKRFTKFSNSVLKFTGFSQLAAIVSTLLFFLWTNFGVVVTTNMYTKDFSGLIQSYISGLPFLKIQLAGNLLIVPAIFLVSYLVINSKKLDLPSLKLRQAGVRRLTKNNYEKTNYELQDDSLVI